MATRGEKSISAGTILAVPKGDTELSNRAPASARRDWVLPGLIGSGLLVLAAAFPWDAIVWHTHWARVAWIPFVSRPIRPETLDAAGNILLFVPLGVMAGLAFRRGAIVAGGLALTLSLFVESAQLYSHSRFPSATDVVCNVAGAVAAAALVRHRAHSKSERVS